MLMGHQVKNFGDWYSGFLQHGSNTTIQMGGDTYEMPLARGEACDETKTEVFQNVDDPNNVKISIVGMDMAKMGPMLQSEAFKAMGEKALLSQDPPSVLMDMPPPGAPPPSTPPTPPPPPDMWVVVEVADADKWIAGYKAHATSTTGTWGYDVGMTRSEVCDESRSKVYKSAKRPNVVAAMMCGVKVEKLGPMTTNPNWARMSVDLGEGQKEGQKAIKLMVPPPAPPV